MDESLRRTILTAPLPPFPEPRPWVRRYRSGRPYAMALLAVAIVTGLIAWIPGATRIATISLLYLLAVIGTGLQYGSAPAVFAAIVAFLAFDVCFVEPRYTFTIADPAEWLSLLMFLFTALVTGHLTARLRASADQAIRREREAVALEEMSWTIASQVSTERALAEVLQRLTELVGAEVAAIVTRDGPHGLRRLASIGPHRVPDPAIPVIGDAIDYVLSHGRPIAWDDDRHRWDKVLAAAGQANAVYVPLLIEHRTLGVLYLEIPPGQVTSAHLRRLVESLANHAAVILERERLARTETMAKALSEADRLKTALLSMVSHDFRSPLAAIKASAASILSAGTALDPTIGQELLGGVIQETDRLDRMVGNILALSRLDADAWAPQTEPTQVPELIEEALATVSPADNRRIHVHIPQALPEAWLDPVQIARVLHNLVENALKYAPPDSAVDIQVTAKAEQLQIAVLDRGPGFGPDEESQVFERFYRSAHLRESAVPGLGIGLAICRGLVEAHGGTLTAGNREGGGAQLIMTLPNPSPVMEATP